MVACLDHEYQPLPVVSVDLDAGGMEEGVKIRPGARSWPTRTGGWLKAVTSRGPNAARRVLWSPERLQQPSGVANAFLQTCTFLEPSALPHQPHPLLPVAELQPTWRRLSLDSDERLAGWCR